MRRNKDTDSSCGLTEGATKVSGRMENKTEEEFIETRKEFRGQDSGQTERKSSGLID